MKIKLLVTIVLLITAMVHAGIDTKTVTANGQGETYLEAVDVALIDAAQQVHGAGFKIARTPLRMFTSQTDAAMILGSGSLSQSVVAIDTSVSVYLKQFKGYVKSYKIVSANEVSAKDWRVAIEAEVYVYKDTTLGQILRDTVAVLPLTCSKTSYDFFDTKVSAAELTDGIAAELGVQFVSSDKLDVLDRKFLSSISAENNLVTSGPQAHKQQVLLGLISGADYLVVGNIRDFRVSDLGNYSESLGIRTHKYQAKMTLDLKIIATATSKVIAADTLDFWLKNDDILSQRRDTDDRGQLDVKDQLLIITRSLAQGISDKTIETIYPARVASIIGEDIVINVGGNNVLLGDRYRIEAGAEVVIDPQTGEPLGKAGGANVIVEVVSVSDKLSTCRIITGELSALTVGDIARRILPTPASQHKGRRGSIQPGEHGVKLPGDK